MNHNSFPSGEQTTDQNSSDYVESLKDVEPFDPEAAKAAREEAIENSEEEKQKLEEIRDKYIDATVLKAIGGTDRILSLANSRSHMDNDEVRERVINEIRKKGITIDIEEWDSLAYRLANLSIAGSKEGLNKALKLDVPAHQERSPRATRMVDIGVGMIDDRTESVVSRVLDKYGFNSEKF